MALAPGDKLGPYEIVELLGEGGMGQVWKARDTRLERFVAIKTSRQGFDDRFRREALAIAALNHPGICTLYDVGPDYFVMELVDGKPIAGPMPVAEALRLAEQILEALDAAHSEGITHRDLKPANILLSKNGIKILDFGLAKRVKPVSAAPLDDETQTMAAPLTREGSILGTLQYMSPEQVEGKEADARSDLFAFGVILYELATGRRPFAGETQASLLASILKDTPPPLHELQAGLPEYLDTVLRTCLQKDPAQRFQAAREVKLALTSRTQTEVMAAPAPSTTQPRLRFSRQLAIAAVAVALAAVLAVAYLWTRSSSVSRIQIPLAKDSTFSVGGAFAISPDGQKLLFSALDKQSRPMLWVQNIGEPEPKLIPNTRHDTRSVALFWTSDSKRFVIAAGNAVKLDIDGGEPELLTQIPNGANSGSWSKDAIVLFGTADGIRKLETSGETTLVTATDATRRELKHGDPSMLPDGRHFLYTRYASSPEAGGLFLGSLDDGPSKQDLKRIIPDPTRASFVDADGGKMVFLRSGTLFAQSFDPQRRELSGSPVAIADDVGASESFAYWSMAPTGTLIYRNGATFSRRILTWSDRQGKAQGTVGGLGDQISLRLSPDATRVLYTLQRADGTGSDIEVFDMQQGRTYRLTENGTNTQGTWSQDGKQIAWALQGPNPAILVRASDGTSPTSTLISGASLIFGAANLQAWSPDGKYFVSFGGGGGTTRQDIWAMSVTGRPPVPIVRTKGNDAGAYLSPNGRWIAYRSDVSGKPELMVQAFTPTRPDTDDTQRWVVSNSGSLGMGRWSKDGRELLYTTQDGTVMAVPVTTEGTFTAGTPVPLFQLPKFLMALGANPGQFVDVTPDHQRFLMSLPVTMAKSEEFSVVRNWPALLTDSRK
jgi:serine/threonine protein kinase